MNVIPTESQENIDIGDGAVLLTVGSVVWCGVQICIGTFGKSNLTINPIRTWK
jgi:hypothetical protein